MHTRHGSNQMSSAQSMHFPVDPQSGYRYESSAGAGAEHGGTALPPLAEALQADYGGLGPGQGQGSKADGMYPPLENPLYASNAAYANGSNIPEGYSAHSFANVGGVPSAAHARAQSFSTTSNNAFYPHAGGSSTSSPGTSSRRGSGASQSNRVYNFVSLPGVNAKKRPRRRFEEIERLYNCNHPGCAKSYGTLNHLNAHVTMQKHGPKRFPIEFKELRKQWRKKKRDRDDRDPRADLGRGDLGDARDAMHLPQPQHYPQSMQSHPAHLMSQAHNGSSHLQGYPSYMTQPSGPLQGHPSEHGGYVNFEMPGGGRGPFDPSSGLYGQPQGSMHSGHAGMQHYQYPQSHGPEVGSFGHPQWSNMNVPSNF